jgi:predicted enzyme related to lactoylglutathione lyase
MCRAHGRAVAGINGQPGPAGFPPSWVTYLATDDLDAAQRFYGALFDYGFDTVDVGSGSGSGPAYRTFSVNGDMVGGMLQTGADWPEGSSATWTPYLAVDDVDAAAQHVEALGGSVRTQPTDSPFGRWSAVADPQAAALILLTMPAAAAG